MELLEGSLIESVVYKDGKFTRYEWPVSLFYILLRNLKEFEAFHLQTAFFRSQAADPNRLPDKKRLAVLVAEKLQLKQCNLFKLDYRLLNSANCILPVTVRNPHCGTKSSLVSEPGKTSQKKKILPRFDAHCQNESRFRFAYWSKTGDF